MFAVYKSMADAMKKHPEADVLISFASLRSAYDSTIETLSFPQVSVECQLNCKWVTADFVVIHIIPKMYI